MGELLSFTGPKSKTLRIESFGKKTKIDCGKKHHSQFLLFFSYAEEGDYVDQSKCTEKSG
ncbi:hypothetical protein RV09_GL000117 [Enterococcus moraviensis]|nr:hypothetical protein RV09_GL000117 [Enterococcus moraviensis]